MKIYVGHVREGYNFQDELYNRLKKSKLAGENEFIFPHETVDSFVNSKELFQNRDCDLFVAEVSFPSTGLGIELGFAKFFEIPILCVYKSGCSISNSIRSVTSDIIEYDSPEEVIDQIGRKIKDIT